MSARANYRGVQLLLFSDLFVIRCIFLYPRGKYESLHLNASLAFLLWKMLKYSLDYLTKPNYNKNN